MKGMRDGWMALFVWTVAIRRCDAVSSLRTSLVSRVFFAHASDSCTPCAEMPGPMRMGRGDGSVWLVTSGGV